MSNEEINGLFEQAVDAGTKRDYPKAISLLTHIINNYDYPPKILLYLGRSYHAVGDFYKAADIFEFFLRINPASIPGHFFLGRTCLTIDLYQQAVTHLQESTKDTKSPYYFTTLSLLAIAFLKLKKPEIAVSYFEKALQIEPQNQKLFTGYLNALFVKAIKLYRKNDLEESAKIFEFLLQNKGNSILPHLYLARIYRLLGANQKALLHYDTASKMAPEDQSLKLQKAVTLLKLGNRQEAEYQLEQLPLHFNKATIKTLNPYQLLRFITMTHFQKNDYRKAIYYAKEILKENYADVDMHVVIAESYVKLGDLGKAKNHYLRSLEKEKNKVELYYGLFNILWEKREYEELLQKVRRVLRSNQHDSLAAYFYALCYSQIGENPKEIFTLLQNQIREKGPDPLLMIALGEAYLAYDMPDLAESWFLRTLKIRPEDKKTIRFLIILYQKLDNPKKEKEFIEHYFELFPDDNQMRKSYIKLLIRLKTYKKAIKEILTLIPSISNKESLKKMLAHCYMKIKDYKDAILIYKELLQYTPDNLEHLKNLIICLESAGNRKYAIALIQKAVSFFKRNTEILFMLGTIYYRDGDYERAIKTFKEILADQPQNWIAIKNIGQIYKKTGNKIFADKFLKRAESIRIKKK
ncbi:MAG: tetratricopeptide repeat protein [Spirochaetales bacterium]|nr:tetratricopeptide repeat protein [Spirochaetales bacterium]